MITDTGLPINNPKVNQVVFYKPWMGKNDKRKKPYAIIINEGDYMTPGGLSNFWYWQRVSPTGRINPKVEHGYGNFTKAVGYEISRKIVVKSVVEVTV